MENGFSLVRERPVPALNLTVEEYDHKSGAKHYHLHADNVENVFMLALRTVPEDSTGVAHILEHTALCGSEKFPVRDPFFLMIRRSLNTFMNAFTTSDYTAYPFASQSRKDYFNLMEVYLDAVFFSRLDRLDFAQEGHRVEFEVPDDPDSPLVYKGVVYNEMKGDSSSPHSMLYQAIQEVLYPVSTYHYNSGGDPRHIPELTYEGLQAFYRSHYHPANAIFMTFGDIAATEQQDRFAELALNRHPGGAIPPIAVKPERRYQQPVVHETSYAVDDADLTGKTHIVIAWLLGQNTDLEMLLRGHLLSDVLLDTSASPLRHALESSELATAVSPMSGFEEDHMEMNFMCGVEGTDPEHAEAIEDLILQTLAQVAEEGIALDRLEAVVHQLELSQREVGGDGMPYGLQLIFSCMSAAVHRGDPIALLDLDAAIAKLRADIQEPDFIQRLIREQLLDNSHRVRVVMKPDRDLGSRLIAEEKLRLEQRRSQLDAGGARAIIDQAKALADRQQMTEDVTVLPQVTAADIPSSRHFTSAAINRQLSRPVSINQAGTNGIVYHQVVRPLPSVATEQLAYLPVYNQVVTEVGSAGRGYLETQHLQHSVTGGVSAFSSLRSSLDNTDELQAWSTISSRTLARKGGALAKLVRETVLTPRFDELERLSDIVQQVSLRRINGIATSGHQYAMMAAASRLRPASKLNNYLSGVPAVMRLQQLARQLEDPSSLDALAASLEDLHAALTVMPEQLLIIADPEHIETFVQDVDSAWQSVPSPRNAGDQTRLGFSVDGPLTDSVDTAYVTTTQVNHCAAAYITVPESHPDSAALSILGGVLRNHFLHSEIREKGGAYGGGAGHDSTNGVFRFYSYRDPRLLETFEIFEAAVDWIQSGEITDAMLEEAVLGVISSVDAPGSPAGEIRQAYHHALFGRSSAHREASRLRYLDVRQDDIRRVARQYLNTEAAKAVVTSENRLTEIDRQFSIVRVAD